MKIKVQIERPLFKRTQLGLGGRIHNVKPQPRPFIDTLEECAGPQDLKCLQGQRVADIPVRRGITESSTSQWHFMPTKIQSRHPEAAVAPASRGVLNRVFAWLQTSYRNRNVRKLRVTETVSLGEKRFVAILHVDDRKYLIGGGASSVALLTSIDDPGGSHSTVQADPSRELPVRVRGVY